MNPVIDPGFPTSAETYQHYARQLTLETDCADVGAAMALIAPGFVLVDVRSVEAYDESHVPGAVSLPHADISKERMAEYPDDTLFVTYCWGPHCNGATRGAMKLAALGFPVKEMLGGVWGWEMEGYAFA